MDSDKGESTLAERDADEAKFFGNGAWMQLPQASLGIGKLRSRLSRVLLSHIISELPSLIAEIDAKYKACYDQLLKLGKPRASLSEQKGYLFELGQLFQTLIKASVDGTYNNLFFQDAKTTVGYQQRIRAVIQNLNREFSSDISKYGHFREIISGPIRRMEPQQEEVGRIRTTKSQFIEHIQDLIRRTRGRELPTTFSPMIIVDLFREQAQPWEAIVKKQIRNAWEAVNVFLSHVLTDIADEPTAKALRHEIIDPAMRDIFEDLSAKTTEILAPHKAGHPITYNHNFIETLKKVRHERNLQSFANTLKEFFGKTVDDGKIHLSGSYDIGKLASSLARDCNEPDMERFAAQEALDCLDAYYQVSNIHCISVIAMIGLTGMYRLH